MVFSSAAFLFLFLPVTALVYYSPLCRRMTVKNVWLLLLSLVFYAWGEPVYVALMVLSILMNWLFGRLLSGRKGTRSGRGVVLLACLCNLGLLFVMKYLGWILGMAGLSGSRLASLSLPVGISFYTFQALSYVIDVYRRQAEPQKNLLHVGLYIAFFPQLIAGPIVRYADIARQIRERVHSVEKFCAGLWRFAVGLAKKMLLANQLAVLAEQAFGTTADERSVLLAWLGVLAYGLQIFFDFSGYSDMAIGLAQMFGFDLKENFNFPYISRSVTEFWKRWHISLTTWFREYVYIPLGGSHCSRLQWLRNFFAVWLLTGIWHGASWTYVLWGLLQGLVIAVERTGRPLERKGAAAAGGFLFTFLFTLFSWALFNAGSLSAALGYWASMLGLSGNAIVDAAGRYWLGQFAPLLLAGTFFSLPVLEWLQKILDSRTAGEEVIPLRWRLAGTVWTGGRALILLLFFVICCAQAISGEYNPFIYFNF